MVLSFGGPEGPHDVMPFLRNVVRGRNVPDERLAEVAEQYHRFGGRSPINDHCRALVAAIETELASHGHDLPVYWGNRNWLPYVTDTVARMGQDGVRRALVFTTSTFGSYSGCRQYREDLARARETVGPTAPELRKLRLFYNHPGFIEPMAERLRAARPDADGAAHRFVFTAHSIPTAMAASCSYEAQLREAAQLVMDEAGWPDRPFDLAYQSRSGPPHIPWLEPDINDHLEALAAPGAGVDSVTVVPIGFVSDHMEVMFDLDTQAAETAARLRPRLRPGRDGRYGPPVRVDDPRADRRAAMGATPPPPGGRRPMARRLSGRPLHAPGPATAGSDEPGALSRGAEPGRWADRSTHTTARLQVLTAPPAQMQDSARVLVDPVRR